MLTGKSRTIQVEPVEIAAPVEAPEAPAPVAAEVEVAERELEEVA